MPPKKSNTAVAKKATPATRAAPKRAASNKVEMPAAKKAEAPATKKVAAKKAPANKKAPQQVEQEPEEDLEEEVVPATKATAKKPAAKKAAPKKAASKAPAKMTAEAEEQDEEDAPAPAKKSSTKKTTSAAAPKVQEKPNTKRKRTARLVEEKDEAPPAKRGKRAAPVTTQKTSKRGREEDDAAEEPAPKKVKQASKPAARKTSKPAASKTSKPAAPKTSKPAAPKTSKRRRVEDEAAEEPALKKAKKVTPPARKVAAPKAAKPKAARPKKAAPPRKVINTAPAQPLDVFVFGEGGVGELGLGYRRLDGKKPLGVRRPRLNPNLQNCVEVFTGAMHGIALTQDNKVITWGVNDGDALGRDTFGDANNDPKDPDDSGLNPFESVPTEIDMRDVAPGTVFTQVVASDSASFALTDDGQVYGWGEFRSVAGGCSFIPGVPKIKPKPDSDEKRVHMAPMLLPWLKKVTKLAAGENHMLALEGKTVKAWGNGESFELARRLVERHAESALVPQSIGLPRGVNPVKLACGASHNFVIDDKDRLWGWGLNNYNQLGLELTPEDLMANIPSVQKPTLITLLEPYKIVDIDGGNHFTVACTDDGRVLTWGRVESRQCGLPDEMLTEANGVIFTNGVAKIAMPTVVPGLKDIVKVSAGPEHAVVIAKDGKAYSWGFSDNYQTGQGETETIEEPEHIDNSAVRNVKLIWAGCGAQWSAVAAAAKPAAPPPPVFLFGAAAAAAATTGGGPAATGGGSAATGSGLAADGAAAGSGTAAEGATTAGNATA